jgi:glycosyltransferase involved in cell wall biosynthesis
VKILVVHQHYLFPGQPGGSRFNEMAEYWTRAGHDVTVIAGALNYASSVRHPLTENHWCVPLQEGSAKVWRCHVPETYNSSYMGRMWAFFGFVLSASTAALRVPKPDVIIATSPPLTLVIPAWIAARVRHRNVPWVFEVRDLWPESAVTTGVLSASNPLTRVLYSLEKWACRSASIVTVLTPAFRDNLIDRGLVNDAGVVVIPNGADTSLFSPRERNSELRRRMGWDDRCVAVYAGAHGRANAIGQLVDAAEHIRHRSDILIVTVGAGPELERWQAEAHRRQLHNIVFMGPQAKEQMPAILAAADVGLAVLQRNETFKTVYPNKVFDYMCMSLPTVIAIDGIARKLVCDEACAGVYVEPENGKALAAALEQLADAPDHRRALGDSGRKWVLQNATRESLADKYLAVLQRTARTD